MRVGEAAQYLGVSVQSLHRWSKDDGLPCYRMPGGERRFRRRDLDAWLEAHRE